MRRLLFWGLLPLVLPQALWVRTRAPCFPAAAGPARGSHGSGRPCRLLAIGDSIVAGVGVPTLGDALAGRVAAALATRLPRRVDWEARGQVGATSRRVLEQLVPALPLQPYDVIVVSVGVNDVTSLERSNRWAESLGELLDALREHSPDAAIGLSGLPPLAGFPLLPQPLRALFGMRARSFDEIARRQAAAREGVAWVPLRFEPLPEKFSADGYHPAPQSYAELGAVVADALLPLLSDRPRSAPSTAPSLG